MSDNRRATGSGVTLHPHRIPHRSGLLTPETARSKTRRTLATLARIVTFGPVSWNDSFVP